MYKLVHDSWSLPTGFFRERTGNYGAPRSLRTGNSETSVDKCLVMKFVNPTNQHGGQGPRVPPTDK